MHSVIVKTVAGTRALQHASKLHVLVLHLEHAVDHVARRRLVDLRAQTGGTR
jgi:hypothetical protein